MRLRWSLLISEEFRLVVRWRIRGGRRSRGCVLIHRLQTFSLQIPLEAFRFVCTRRRIGWCWGSHWFEIFERIDRLGE
jgi:hypothetical protein